MDRRVRRWSVTALAIAGAFLGAPLGRAGFAPTKGLFASAEGPLGIAVDAAGVIHLSWRSIEWVRQSPQGYKVEQHHLHYMRIERGKKVDQVVDATESGAFSSIALDSAGRPHIAYQAVLPATPYWELRYARFDGSAWQVEDLGPGGFAAAIVIDADDQPHVVHVTGQFPAAQAFEYLHREDSGWVRETPAGLYAWPGSPMSLALDGAGHAHVGMQNAAHHPAYATNASGDWESVELANASANVTSLALDSGGHPHVALPLTDGATVRYLHFDGAEWLSEDLLDPNDVPPGVTSQPWAASLVLDAHDRPQVLFQDSIHEIQTDYQAEIVMQAYHDGVAWRAIPVSLRAEQWTRLAIDPNGVTYGAYALYPNRPDTGSELARLVRLALPDLTGSWTTLAVTDQGGKSRVGGVLEVGNDGAGKSKSAPIALFLSSDATLDPGDTRLPTRSATGALAPGQTRAVKISFVRPGSLAGLYLIAVLDPDVRLDDLDRPNNTIAAPLGD